MDLPSAEIKEVAIIHGIPSIVKEFRGPYEESPAYIEYVKEKLDDAGIDYIGDKVIGIYFDNPQGKDPKTLRCLAGVLTRDKKPVADPLMNFELKGKYLYTKIAGTPKDAAYVGYMRMYDYVRENDIELESDTGIQITSYESGKYYSEIFMKLPEKNEDA
ncbi:MAG: GyrI-like domain-containing protein [Bacteroidota bacterium]